MPSWRKKESRRTQQEIKRKIEHDSNSILRSPSKKTPRLITAIKKIEKKQKEIEQVAKQQKQKPRAPSQTNTKNKKKPISILKDNRKNKKKLNNKTKKNKGNTRDNHKVEELQMEMEVRTYVQNVS